MKTNSVYEFTVDDFVEVITFCRDYHLDITKQSSGRTGSGPRGLGGEIDAFGPGKLNEIAVSKLLSTDGKKRCSVDNQIYSNYEVGIKTIPDLVEVVEAGAGARKPNLYIEVKKISESDQWLGIHTDQLKSILRDSQIKIHDIFLIFGEVYFQDNKNRKQQDFLGAFLNSSMSNTKVNFQAFSQLNDLRCKIHYVLSITDLQTFGHEFKAGGIIPDLHFSEAKQVFRSDGRLWKGLKVEKTLKGKSQIEAPGIDGQRYDYGKFECYGHVQVIKKKGNSRTYLSILSDTTIRNDFFGELEFKKGETIFFNIRNMLAGLQGSKVKTKSDWWISRRKLDQLIKTGSIVRIEEAIKLLRKNI
jgi:hypothetical protein